MNTPRVRRSIADIQADYDRGDKLELEALMRAWKGIKELPADDPRSFFMLGGFHGEPFRGPGATDPSWWGGYCQHGTVLFPSWHRAYLFKLEEALRSIPGCEDVALPFWDECSDAARTSGIPRALTDRTFTLDDVEIDNPLRSFVFPVAIVDDVEGDNALYSKPAGYETVRYPLSGLVGTAEDRAATAAHNALFPDYATNVALLETNIVAWLNTTVTIGTTKVGEIYNKFVNCLKTPTYTLFSNTTSMSNWNKHNPKNLVVALESPHNNMHLAVGGFDVPGQGDFSPIAGANGDMGENDTAGVDPIFYFHHCFIDYTFWSWQRKNGFTDGFTIDETDPGAMYNAAINPPPAGADLNAPMTMATRLDPFKKADGTPYVTSDVVNIETQLGYRYGPGSLDKFIGPAAENTGLMFAEAAPQPDADARTVHIGGIDRAKIRGSFLISVYAEVAGEEQLVGREAVLSRWHVQGCANCMSHLKVSADFRLPEGAEDEKDVRVEIRTRAGISGRQHAPSLVAAVAGEPSASVEETRPALADIEIPFSLSVR